MKIAKWNALGCVVSALLVWLGGVGIAKAQTPATPEMYPQIVRLSYVEGDVRLASGPAGEKTTGAEWEKAAVDVPIYSGFTLVTGAGGKAEVEFEDASRVYLNENSVLSFGELAANASLRRSELDLVSGVMTIDAQTAQPGGVSLIVLKTPTNGFSLRSPWHTFMRVNSYLDGMELTPMVDHTKVNTAVGLMDASSGQKLVFKGVEKIPTLTPSGTNDFAAWDEWVRARSAEHSQAMNVAMKDAGLNSPIPGLTEMASQGSFFDCAPYGKCWAPKDGWDESAAAPPAANAAQPPAAAWSSTTPAATTQVMAAPMMAGTQACSALTRINCVEEDDFFPCSPSAMRNFYDRDPVTGRLRLVFSETGGFGYPRPYLWGVCHTGSWIRWHRRYVWVAGPHRHHRWGVRWVKVGGKTGFVPVHPRDEKGKPPLNIKHGVYVDAGKKDHGTVLIKVSEPVKLLDNTPKEFAKLVYPALPKTEAPHMEAHQLHEANTAHHSDAVQLSHATLNFDHKTQSFQVARTVNDGGHEHVVTQPVGGRSGMEMNRTGFSSNNGTSNAYRGSAQSTGFNSGSGASRSYSAPSEGAHYSAPVSAPAPSAPVSAPSAPSSGAHH